MSTTEFRQPTHREELERILVGGAAHQLAAAPDQASAIAKGIKTVLDELAPVAANTVVIAPLPVLDHGTACIDSEIQAKGYSARMEVAKDGLSDAAKRLNSAWGLEREIQAKADKAPRVTPFEVEAHIRSEFYFTAEQGVLGESELGTRPASWTNLDQVTICVLILKNGTKIVGVNEGPVSRENFQADLGRKYARQKAVDQIWPLLGFRLRDELARPVLTDADAAADLAGTPRPDHPTAEAADFLANVKACNLSGEAPCEACQ